LKPEAEVEPESVFQMSEVVLTPCSSPDTSLPAVGPLQYTMPLTLTWSLQGVPEEESVDSRWAVSVTVCPKLMVHDSLSSY